MVKERSAWVWHGGGVIVVIGPGFVVTGLRGLKRLVDLGLRVLYILLVRWICFVWGKRRCW